MPGPEGTYLLEVRTDWEPLGDPAGTRLGRWVRRRRNPTQTTSATRRMTLAVVNSRTPAPVPLTKADGSGIEVDAIDLARATGHRPSASGRAPGDPLGRWAGPSPTPPWWRPAFRDRVRGLDRPGRGRARHPRPGRRPRPGLVGGRPAGPAPRPPAPPDRDRHRRPPGRPGRGAGGRGRGTARATKPRPGGPRRLRLGRADPRRGDPGVVLLAGLAGRRGARWWSWSTGTRRAGPGRVDHPDRAGRPAPASAPASRTGRSASTWRASASSTASAGSTRPAGSTR